MSRSLAIVTASLLSLAFVPDTAAQTPPPPPVSDAVKAMLGTWEMSNAERDKACTITFKIDTTGPGRALELEKTCASTLPIIKEVAAWTLGKDDALRLIDAKGKLLLEMTEVENGLFESVRTTEALYFLQTLAAARGLGRTPDQMFGDWAFVRGTGTGTGKPICQMTLHDTAADTDSFALTVKPGCEALVAGFAPKAWRMDRGQFVLLSQRGETWRFEEGDTVTWRRIPEGKQPLALVKQ